jgi:hypothetical protein
MTAGLGALGFSAVMLIGAALGSSLDASSLGSVGSIAAVGLGLFGMGAIRLPSWASLRRRQMEGVISRLAQLTSAKPQQLPVPEDEEDSGA